MIGIIGAMDIEIDALKAELMNPKSETISGIEYTSGLLEGREVVLAVCGIGKVFAAICAQTMILKYNPQCIINTGVGGSLCETLDVGNIAISTCAVQYDMDTSPIGDPIGLLSGINIVEIPADKELGEKVKTAAEKLGIKFEMGMIATGDRFVAGAEAKEKILGNFNAIACEMEGGAIGHVCYVNHVPFVIIRSMSDNANGDATVDYPAFRVMAANNSKKTVMETVKTIDK